MNKLNNLFNLKGTLTLFFVTLLGKEEEVALHCWEIPDLVE